MTLKQAMKILKADSLWRSGVVSDRPDEKQIELAIDAVTQYYYKHSTLSKPKSLIWYKDRYENALIDSECPVIIPNETVIYLAALEKEVDRLRSKANTLIRKYKTTDVD